MKLIEASYQIIPQQSGLEGIYKQIEIGGRTCYKSEDHICEGSAKKFVDKLAGYHHYSVFEHGAVYLQIQSHGDIELMNKVCWYRNNPYSKVNSDEDGVVYITTNYRVLIENNLLDDLKYLCEPTKHHEKRISVRFITSRSISLEIVRHRTMSFSQTSQRYINYSKKYNGEIPFIIPEWIKKLRKEIANTIDPVTGASNLYLLASDLPDVVRLLTIESRAVKCWYTTMSNAESDYMFLINDQKLKPEEARSVLPNDCATEIMVTGFESDWKHFFELRCSPAAHPDIRVLADKLNKEIA